MSAPGRDQLAVLSIVKMYDMQHQHTNMHHVCIQFSVYMGIYTYIYIASTTSCIIHICWA